MRTLLLTLLCGAALFSADTFRRAPGFSLVDTKLKMHDLADYRGKVVVLELMQTTCPHCMAFTPVLEQVEKRFSDRVAVLAILDPPDTMATGRRAPWRTISRTSASCTAATSFASPVMRSPRFCV